MTVITFAPNLVIDASTSAEKLPVLGAASVLPER
jgi:hypothetical protein